jgi:hypothetical protein
MNKTEAIVEIIKGWSDSELLVAWNEYCDKKGYSDNIIYSMDSFNECFGGMEPLDIIDMVRGCDFSPSDDYFSYTSCGNIISFNYVEDYSEFDYDYLAEFLGEDGDNYTADVDRDELKTAFIEELINTYESLEGLTEDEVSEKFTEFIEENCYDLLTDDWDLMAEEFIESFDTEAETNDEEDK